MIKYKKYLNSIKISNCSKKQLEMTKHKLSQHLLEKRWILPITNACNKICGGCNEMCGLFSKEKIWFLTLEEIERYINLIKNYKKELTIIGGEPTVHPQWNEIVEILYKHNDIKFRVNTNGRLGHKPFEIPNRDAKNVKYFVDTHPEEQTFFPGFIAAQDVLRIEDPKFYWEKAKNDCPIWSLEGASIYNNKAYFCENAAAFDWMYNNGKNGWIIENDKNPFDKTEREISSQAEKFCYRCGWCLYKELNRDQQKVHEKTIVTETNFKELDKKNLVKIVSLEDIEKND